MFSIEKVQIDTSTELQLTVLFQNMLMYFQRGYAMPIKKYRTFKIYFFSSFFIKNPNFRYFSQYFFA